MLVSQVVFHWALAIASCSPEGFAGSWTVLSRQRDGLMAEHELHLATSDGTVQGPVQGTGPEGLAPSRLI